MEAREGQKAAVRAFWGEGGGVIRCFPEWEAGRTGLAISEWQEGEEGVGVSREGCEDWHSDAAENF